MPELNDTPIASLPLWKHLIDKTADQPTHQQMVIRHLNDSFPLLERIIIAFPTYTLHNKQHQYNIMKLMGELLGPRLSDLGGLEAAVLILGAVYHDMGMVYQPQELQQVSEEPEFEEFLKANIAARLQYEEHGKTATEDLVGWYCRWMHAKRVWKFLVNSDQINPFLWDSIPFRDQLGYVCESHNESAAYIKHHEAEFDNNFLGECDLTFCAILLRLSDIMDFDDTRTPLSVYEYLELGRSRKASDQVSDDEWHKHLNSKGFKFERTEGKSTLRFTAAPAHPRTEVGMRNFLKLIEAELMTCSELLRSCSDRWKDFVLPDEINKDGIIGKNYKSGNYHFSLAEDDVMQLLTGEGIYNDDFIFLRELLQNAIDTSRHREFKEGLAGKPFKADAITISFFTDDEGYQWVRIDDYGMGMNQEVIENHLLKKGKSYYKSDAFKLEKLFIQQGTDKDFVPISRFGIGLLSCFIAGDRIEVNTLHKDEPGNAYRLSVEGRNGFFVMQSQKAHHIPLGMPAEHGPDMNFRTKPGTSIAVRITTNREYEGFDMKRQLQRYLMAPPIPVSYNGQFIGGEFDEMLNKPWAAAKSYPMSSEFVARVRILTNLPFDEGIKVTLLPISLTEDSLSENLKGQALMIYIDVPVNTLEKRLDLKFGLELNQKKLAIKYSKSTEENGTKTEVNESDDISYIIEEINLPIALAQSPYFPYDEFHFGGLRLSHNGIRIAETKEMFWLNDARLNNYHEFGSSYNNFSYICGGVIYYQDGLLPDLTVSRNEIRQITFPIVANTLAALRKLNTRILFSSKQYTFDFFKELDRDIEYQNDTIKLSGFYEYNKAFWDKEITIATEEGSKSIEELLSLAPKRLIFGHYPYSSQFYRNLVDYVLESNFDISIAFSKDGHEVKKTYYLHQKTRLLLPGQSGFEPMTFRHYENHKYSLMPDKGINIDHPYTQWYMRAYPTLVKHYFYYSRQLIYALSGSFYSSKPEIDKINRILEKLRKVLPEELRPPTEINLIQKDLEYATGYLKGEDTRPTE